MIALKYKRRLLPAAPFIILSADMFHFKNKITFSPPRTKGTL